MKKSVKLLSLIMAVFLLLTFTLVSCDWSKEDGTPDSESPAPDADASVVDQPSAAPNTEIKIYALNGTTALGMAQMIRKANDQTDSMNYNISLHASADSITGAIVSGECAIAALPTNAAANLYKKSAGKLQLLALNTLGVLYLLDAGNSVSTINDLRGKTVYVPGAGTNPEFITIALLEAAGLKVGTDVYINSTDYPSPDALQTAIIAGQASLAVLPEPKVTVVTTKAPTVSVALNLTTEWEAIYGKNTLVQGCLVVNKAFAEAHPAEVAQFLKDYEASVNYIMAGSAEAIDTIVNAGILPSAAIAQKALPNCNICFIAGESMKPLMTSFCQTLHASNPKAVAAVPDDGFYFVSK